MIVYRLIPTDKCILLATSEPRLQLEKTRESLNIHVIATRTLQLPIALALVCQRVLFKCVRDHLVLAGLQ